MKISTLWYSPQTALPFPPSVPEPAQMDEIIAYSEKLSKGIPQVRVDWYIVDGHVYFGECTFYTWAGYIKFEPEEQDLVMGEWMKLPERK